MSTNPQPPAAGNVNLAISGAVAISVLFALTLVFYGVRLYNRLRPTPQLSIADYAISVALICELIVYITSIIAIRSGFGRYSYYIPAATQTSILKCIFVVALFGSLAAPIARLSIGAMLLRFQLSTARKMLLWVLIIIQLAIALASSLVMLLQCRPIRAFWEQVPGGYCWSNKNSRIYGYTAASMGIGSDLVFAIMPVLFIWPMNRPVMERVLLTILMGLGITATVAGAIKLNYIRTWKYGEEALTQTVAVYMWYRVEEITLIASACAPFLIRTIEGILSRVGLPKFTFVPLSLKPVRSSGRGAAADVQHQKSPAKEQSTEITSNEIA